MSTPKQAVNPTVLDLYRHIKQIEDAGGGWPGGDCVEALCEWLTRHGIDVDQPADHYAPDVSDARRMLDLAARWEADVAMFDPLPDCPSAYDSTEEAEAGGAAETLRECAAQLRAVLDHGPCARCGQPITDPENAPADDTAVCCECGDTDACCPAHTCPRCSHVLTC